MVFIWSTAQMELQKLGNTDIDIPEVGLGAWKYRGGVEPLRRGIDLGAHLIDTAEIYGTESIVGGAIADRRDRVFLATKVAGNHVRYDDVLKAAEASLNRLKTDVIDLYQIHWPNDRVPISETLRAMETLVDRGQIRYIGVSNFSVSQLQQAQAAMQHQAIVSNQVLYSLNQRGIERELLPYCQAQNITIMAYTPLDDGRLAVRTRLRRRRGMQALEAVAAETQKTLAQVALNWCTSRSHVMVIPKSDHIERIEENCGASGWRLSSAQVARLDAAFH
jgi:diketogulonate reductase-like aldo/keto reductase